MKPILNVVAGIVYNAQGQVLLSSRPQGKAYAGYWEFAGGKIEPNETPLAALKREFAEELGIVIEHATLWQQKSHDYEHAYVNLQFFVVEADEWHGELVAKEGQQFCWQTVGDYHVSPMLPANSELLAELAKR